MIWIKRYGEVAFHGSREEFEHYSETLKKWYRVTTTYSPQKSYFVTHFIDVSIEKEWFKTTLLSIGDITVADAYDTMISERPYRKAMSKDAAIKEIRGNAGTQFDSMIPELFIENVIGQA